MGKIKRAIRKAQAAADVFDQLNDAIVDENNLNPEVTETSTNDTNTEKSNIPDVPYKPEFPYSGNQIIIDSGRIHLNAKDDMAFILAKKSIGLSSPGSINIDTNSTFVVNARKIKLGIGPDAEHPLVFGDELFGLLVEFGTLLLNASNELKTAQDSTGTKITANVTAAASLEKAVQVLLERTKRILSTKNFTQ